MNDSEWLIDQFSALKDTHNVLSVSEFTESTRYLPASVSPMPGYYSFDVTPYWREVVDCLSLSSPIRTIAVKKSAQVGATVALVESGLLYCIAHVKNAPAMILTVDDTVAKLRLEQNIGPMLQHSNLDHLIQANDAETNGRKTGKTKDRLSWFGGGYGLFFGSNSPGKLRSFSIQYLFLDEVDGYKKSVGRDGSPVKLAIDRTAGYTQSKKVCMLSTPLEKGNSIIDDNYKLGDQRKYFVPCKKCEMMQTLEWFKRDKETGANYGLIFEHDNGRLDIDSVRYVCKYCGEPHKNADKTKMLNNGEWRATAECEDKTRRSYFINALYSPVGMKSFEACVRDWFECWDVVKNESRDNDKLRTFYNNVLGEPFEVLTDRLKYSGVASHRRTAYRLGEVPNNFAIKHCGSEILVLTCAVDVHKNNLAVAVYGWADRNRSFLVDSFRLYGDCHNLQSEPWTKLKDMIYNKVYIADDGKKYRIQLTAIDSGYAQHEVLEFCYDTDGVIPIKGLHGAQKGSTFSEFKMTETKLGVPVAHLNTNMYKDRWYSSLNRKWSEPEMQHEYCINFPIDMTREQMMEFKAETKVPVKDPVTGAIQGFKWERKGDNENWDLLVYNNATLDILAWDIMIRQSGRDIVNWIEFFDYCKTGNNGLPVFYEQ